jgi:hypothetical protein
LVQLFRYVQCTISMILLLTVGGTPLDAMQRYAPICSRFTLVMLNTEPSTLVAIMETKCKLRGMCSLNRSPGRVPTAFKRTDLWSIIYLWQTDLTPWKVTNYTLLNSIMYLSMDLQTFAGSWQSFSILIIYTDGRTPWTGDQPITRPLLIYRTTQTQNKRIQTSMPWLRFEPTIPVFERAKTVHVLDRVATSIGF